MSRGYADWRARSPGPATPRHQVQIATRSGHGHARPLQRRRSGSVQYENEWTMCTALEPTCMAVAQSPLTSDEKVSCRPGLAVNAGGCGGRGSIYSSSGYKAGSGGGAAVGRIRINTRTGTEVTVKNGAIVSPLLEEVGTTSTLHLGSVR